MKTGKRSTLIGRSEKADFPELELSKLNVKVDSGAYTSAIHCCQIKQSESGQLEVVFLDAEDPNFTGKIHSFSKFEKKNVKSSNGVSEERFVISTQLRFNSESYPIDLSLTFRGDMRFPVLIGRRFLSKNNFIVDTRLKDHIYKRSGRRTE